VPFIIRGQNRGPFFNICLFMMYMMYHKNTDLKHSDIVRYGFKTLTVNTAQDSAE